MTDAIANPIPLIFGLREWFDLFVHYLTLSLLSVGGAISTSPDMYRYLVEQRQWITAAQFNASIAIAQAAPGPNVLFIALLGWNVGLNAGGVLPGLFGIFTTMLGILIPSTTLTYVTAQWGQRNRELRAVRAFKQGMAPIVVALLLATASILAGANVTPNDSAWQHWPVWLLAATTAMVVWRTKIHLLWLLAVGAALGWYGLI